jgi:cobyrinic acid a,c-diamide synthase
VQGLATYRSDLKVAAVLANKVASARHTAMLQESVPSGVQWLGAMPRDPDMAFPERHLGLVQAGEIDDLEGRISASAANLSLESAWVPAPICFAKPVSQAPVPPTLKGTRIAIARDAAFGFIYPANQSCLEALGADLVFFSPLEDASLPPCDAVWLPGGYPELHLHQLSGNHAMIQSVRQHYVAGRPILAECGGMLYCLDELDVGGGERAVLAALLPGKGTMQPRLVGLGLEEVELPSGRLRGHTFHYSQAEIALTPAWQGRSPEGRPGEAVYRTNRLTATYTHLYFASAPLAISEIFDGC